MIWENITCHNRGRRQPILIPSHTRLILSQNGHLSHQADSSASPSKANICQIIIQIIRQKVLREQWWGSDRNGNRFSQSQYRKQFRKHIWMSYFSTKIVSHCVDVSFYSPTHMKNCFWILGLFWFLKTVFEFKPFRMLLYVVLWRSSMVWLLHVLHEIECNLKWYLLLCGVRRENFWSFQAFVRPYWCCGAL